MTNFPFLLGAAAGAGLIYLLKKTTSKQALKGPANAKNDNQESFLSQPEVDKDDNNSK